MIIAIDPFSLIQTVLNTIVTLPTTADSLINLISRLQQKIMSFTHPKPYNPYSQYQYQTLENNNTGNKLITTQNGKVISKPVLHTPVTNQQDNYEDLVRLVVQFLTQFPQYQNYQVIDETQPLDQNLFTHPYIFIPVNFANKGE